MYLHKGKDNGEFIDVVYYNNTRRAGAYNLRTGLLTQENIIT